MTAVQPLSVCPRPTQVVLGGIQLTDSPHGNTGHASPYGDNAVSYLAGREARDSIIVQASFDQICILSRNQRFDQALPFWDAFSGSQNTDKSVTCTAVGLSADSTQIFLAAAMDHRIAVWYAPATSPTYSRKWRVHSTLTINDGIVTTLDIVNGQLLTGTTTSLVLWRLDSSDIPIWKRFWTKPVPSPITVAKFSPDATSIAAVAQGGQNILLWQYQPRSSKPPVLQQRLYHARSVAKLAWRQPPEANSQADVLVSYATDGVARIWAPVIDEPSQLRLWCSVDSSHSRDAPRKDHLAREAFYLDPHVVISALRINISILQREIQMAELGVGTSTETNTHAVELDMDLKQTRLRRLEHLVNETPDMFLSFGHDGFINVTAVANIDRRPPTLLQALTVLRIPFTFPPTDDTVFAVKPLQLHVPQDSASTAPMLMLRVQYNSGVALTYAVNPATFFDGRGAGIELDSCHPCGPPATPKALPTCRHVSRINALCRSGDGKTLLSSAAQKSIVWALEGTSARLTSQLHYKDALRPSVLSVLSWDGSLTASLFGDGKGELRRASDGAKAQFELEGEAQHLALRLLNGSHLLIAVTKSGSVQSWLVESKHELHLIPSTQLWNDSSRHLVSVDSTSCSSDKPGTDLSIVTGDRSGLVEVRKATGSLPAELRWEVTASFHETCGVPQIVRSGADGLVAIAYRDDSGGQTLVVFNSKTTSFNSGEEHRQSFDALEPILALDWSPSQLSNNALAIVFEHRVDVIAPGRSSDVQAGPQWVHLTRLDLYACTPSSIRAACWLGGEQVVVASGSVLYLYGPRVQPVSEDATESKEMHLAELIAQAGGPVVQYHPSFLLQCAVWGKMGLARAIICNLEKAAMACSAQDIADTWSYTDVPFHLVLQDDSATGSVQPAAKRSSRTGVNRSIFDESEEADAQAEADLFSGERIDKLARHLEDIKPPYVSGPDLCQLVTLVKTISEAIREHRSLDASGLRYVLAMRQMLNGNGKTNKTGVTPELQLGYRDFLWALHSENQETLLSAVESAFGNKLDWSAARSTGLFAWLKNPQALRTQAEAVARAQFMSSEDRDPVKCSLIYFALGKRKVIQGLWRQAVWHPEQKKMLQFLSHDFDEERWKTAAQKNAFALLSQRRYEFAASFFMLGESLRDAINVCVRNLDDLSLAIALARIKEGGDDGPIFADLLRTRVLPLAFERGDRWMGSWAFWMLKRRDLAVRIIVTPLRDLLADESVANLLGSKVTCGNDSYNDPALALLFQQLRTKSLQTIKGLYDIPERKVFDFILNTNRALCRMGCDAIGLSLLRNWQFEPASVSSASTLFHRVSKHDLHTLSRVDEAVLAENTDAFSELRLSDVNLSHAEDEAVPSRPTNLLRRTSQSTMSPPSSPTFIRRGSSLLRRRSSIINDLDIGAGSGTAIASQDSTADRNKSAMNGSILSKSQSGDTQTAESKANLTAEPAEMDRANGVSKESSAKRETAEPKKQGISIFKSAAASNSQQGAQEFDFGSFGF